MAKKEPIQRAKIDKLWIAVTVLFIIQAITIGFIIKQQIDTQAAAPSLLNRFINESESRRYTVPVIDVSENRVYIPESRIFFTLTDISRKLQYYISTQSDKKDLYLSLTGVIGHQSSADDSSCDRMVRLSTSKDSFSNEKFAGEVMPTKDGLRYIFQNISHCNIYPKSSSDALVKAAELMQSY
jgi:hypothetical protein